MQSTNRMFPVRSSSFGETNVVALDKVLRFKTLFSSIRENLKIVVTENEPGAFG